MFATCLWSLKESNSWWVYGKNHKYNYQNCGTNNAECEITGCRVGAQFFIAVKVSNCHGNKINGDINPIYILPKDAGIGVEEHNYAYHAK